jgi:hypothetical protein
MTRERDVQVPPRFSQDEVALVRRFRVPDARTFGVRGTARLDPAAPDDVLDAILGIPGADAGGITVTSSQHLPADVNARGSSAFDGDPATAWSTAIGSPQGQWVDVRTSQPVTFDHLDLQVIADGQHSVPTQLQIDAGGQSRTVDVPAVADGKAGSAPVAVPVSFAPLTGDDVKITVTQVRPVQTLSYPDDQPQVMPVAVAEFGVPGVQRAAMPATLPSACRSDLVRVDGDVVPMQLSGSTTDAAAGKPVDLQRCPDAAASLQLDAGDHVLRSAAGSTTGVDVDGMVLGSDTGGAAMTLGARGELPTTVTQAASTAGATPRVEVTSKGSTKVELKVTGAQPGTPFWLVLGESNNAGWQANVDGKDIGGSTLVDGYANGWRVAPPSGSFTVTLKWTPQEKVWIAIGVSVIVFLVCLWLALRRRRAPSDEDVDDDVDEHEVDEDAVPVFANPLVAAGAQPRPLAIVVGALAVGIVGAAVSRWWVGLLAAALVALVALVPRTRFLVSVGAPLALAAAALYVVVQQYRYDYVADLDWPGRFRSVHDLVCLAVVLLIADVVIEVLRRRARERVRE